MWPLATYAQDSSVTGLEYPSEAVYKSMKFAALPRISFGAGFDDDYILEGFPPVESQGMIGSCVSWATTYYLFSHLNMKENGWVDYQTNGSLDKNKIFSPLYVHNQVKVCQNDCIKCGSSNYDALEFLSKYGTVTITAFSELGSNNPTACRITPDPNLKPIASRKKLKNYSDIINPYFKYQYGEKFNLIKNALLSRYPVILGMPVDENFKAVRNKKDFQWTNFIGDPLKAENHSMLCIGFSDKRDAIYVVNSWSPTWGDKGHGWISRSVLERYLQEAYITNVPNNFLVTVREIEKSTSIPQSSTSALTEVNILKINDPKKSFFITNRYREFDNFRIIPVSIRANYAILRFYNKDGDKLEVIDVPSMGIGKPYIFSSEGKSYKFEITAIKPWRFFGKRAVFFTIENVGNQS